jgi:transketolase
MVGKSYKKFAAQIRLETVKEVGKRGFGHIGGALSIVDLLAVLYGGTMKIDPQNPNWEERDKWVISKGHAGPGLYAALALKGYFPMDWLETLNQPETHLPSHCDRLLTPGVDMTTGSLGQGVSTAIGLALAQKKRGYDSYTYLVTGDGELDEGQCWEGALFAPSQGIDNLIWFVDNNHKQLDGRTEDVVDLLDIAEKFRAFGWHAMHIEGDDPYAIDAAITEAKSVKETPSCIVLNTIKGAGVPCIADTEWNHHMPIEGAFLSNAIAECTAALTALEGGNE